MVYSKKLKAYCSSLSGPCELDCYTSRGQRLTAVPLSAADKMQWVMAPESPAFRRELLWSPALR